MSDRASAARGRLHVEVVGDGPPLVLLHGWAMHGGVFAPLVDALRGRYALHLVDLPGHGRSAQAGVPLRLDATTDALLAQLPVAPWCAWSLGGLFALRAAHAHPERVSALAMVCATPRFVRGDAADGNGDRWRYGVSAEIFADFAHGLRHDYRATLERFVALEAFGSDRARDTVRALRDALFARGEPDAAALADGLDLLRATDLRALLPGLRVPTLWIAGRRDRLVDPRAMRQAAELAPGSRFVQFEHAAHAPFLTDAEEMAAVLDEFLREHAATRHASRDMSSRA